MKRTKNGTNILYLVGSLPNHPRGHVLMFAQCRLGAEANESERVYIDRNCGSTRGEQNVGILYDGEEREMLARSGVNVVQIYSAK